MLDKDWKIVAAVSIIVGCIGCAIVFSPEHNWHPSAYAVVWVSALMFLAAPPRQSQTLSKARKVWYLLCGPILFVGFLLLRFMLGDYLANDRVETFICLTGYLMYVLAFLNKDKRRNRDSKTICQSQNLESDKSNGGK